MKFYWKKRQFCSQIFCHSSANHKTRQQVASLPLRAIHSVTYSTKYPQKVKARKIFVFYFLPNIVPLYAFISIYYSYFNTNNNNKFCTQAADTGFEISGSAKISKNKSNFIKIYLMYSKKRVLIYFLPTILTFSVDVHFWRLLPVPQCVWGVSQCALY